MNENRLYLMISKLPKELQSELKDTNTLIVDTLHDKLKTDEFKSIKESEKCMEHINIFAASLSSNDNDESVQIWPVNDSKFKCMIQITGHVTNKRNSPEKKLFHTLITKLFNELKPVIKEKFNLDLDYEYDDTHSLEGFDVYTTDKVAKQLWDQLGGMSFKESYDDIVEYSYCDEDGNYATSMYEASRGDLNYSFRLGINPENGHIIKVVFDLKPDDVKLIGKEFNQDNRNAIEDSKLINNIKKLGNNDFKSAATVKAIIDMDTKQQLQSVKMGGIIGRPISVPDKYKDDMLGQDADVFTSYPVNIREKIIKDHMNIANIQTFTVGKKEIIPTYKATRAASSINELILNQYDKRARGHDSTKLNHKIHVGKLLDKRINKFNRLRDEAIRLNSTSTKLDDVVRNTNKRFIEKSITRFNTSADDMKVMMSKYKDDNFGQNVYAAAYRRLDNELDKWTGVLEDIILSIKDSDYTIHNESIQRDPESNIKLPKKRTYDTLGVLLAPIINNNIDVNNYILKSMGNLITHNLLKEWAPEYKRVMIDLLHDSSNLDFEFIPPKLSSSKNTQNIFIERFINGRETISSFLQQTPSINIKVSKKLFKTFNSSADIILYFKDAIKYYAKGIDEGGIILASELMKLSTTTKELLSGPLNGVVVYAVGLLFIFQNVDGQSKKPFQPDKKLIKQLVIFINNIISKYSDPEKDKNKIISDIKSLVDIVARNTTYTETTESLHILPSLIESYYNGRFNDNIRSWQNKFEYEQCDSYSDTIIVLNEAVKAKRLKKIPSDLIPYIIIEGESVKTANDKMMIVSYAYGKLEIIDWYIELLEVGSKNYIVPHTKSELESIRTHLLAAITNIMNAPLPKVDRPIIDIKYPKGYEG